MATKKEPVIVEEGTQTLFVEDSKVPLLEQQIKELTKTRDELTQKVFDLEKEKTRLDLEHKAQIEAMKKEAEIKAKTTETLSSKFNDLAKLFDEYIKGTDDMVELYKLFLRNNLRTQELLQNKIKAFNGDEGESK